MTAKRQKSQLELAFGAAAKGEARSAATAGTEAVAAIPWPESPAALGPSMEAMVERNNLRRALAQVRRNKGAPGVDGMTVDDLPLYLKDHWPSIRNQLLDGSYEPQPVLRVEVPKATGGVRALGIPTVLDRFIQQAALQVLQAVRTRRSRIRATAFGRVAPPIRRWPGHKPTSRKGTAGWLTLIWRNSSIGSITIS